MHVSLSALIAVTAAVALPWRTLAFTSSVAPLLRTHQASTSPLSRALCGSSAMGGACQSMIRTATPSRKRSVVVLQMADDTFATCKVTANKEAAEGLRLITVDVGSLSSDYKVPGQYVKMRKDDAMEKPGFFAIASAPAASPKAFDFLIKRTDGSAWLCDTAEGGEVEVSTVQGPGYRYAEKFGADIEEVIVLATGSGIAPLKAAIESKGLKGKKVRLYYGCKTPSSCAFTAEIPSWEKDCGATVVQCFSQVTSDLPKGARKGYVQAAVMEDGIASPSKTGVLFCGVNDMVKQAKEALEEAGVKPENMLQNF